MWIAEEKRYVRETLKTRDLETAIARAEKRFFEIYSDVASGKKLFSLTLGELIDEYLKWRSEDVAGAKITADRLVTLKSHLKHLRAYKGQNTQISEFDRISIYNYEQWRRATNAAQLVTIRNEQSTINHMMKFAYRLGYAHFDKFDFPVLKIREVARRDVFTLDEYDKLVRTLRKWTSKAEVPNERDRLERLTIRDCILIGSNTMLRVGELWQLRWGDIIGFEESTDEINSKVTLVTLNVRSEIAKTRKSRLITCRGGEYFKRVYERTNSKSKTDLIFCGATGEERFSKRKFYDAWEQLMLELGIDYKARNLTWYSLRHFGITCRLRAGASIFDVAKIAGTSATFIENNYGHFDQSMAKAAALKNFSISKEGISLVGLGDGK